MIWIMASGEASNRTSQSGITKFVVNLYIIISVVEPVSNFAVNYTAGVATFTHSCKYLNSINESETGLVLAGDRLGLGGDFSSLVLATLVRLVGTELTN